MGQVNRQERYEKIPAWVLADGGPWYEINGAAARVYGRLCALDRKHGERRYAYVSMAKLAATCKISAGTVSKAIAELVKHSMIERLNYPSKEMAGMYGIVRFAPRGMSQNDAERPASAPSEGFLEETVPHSEGFLQGGPIQTGASPRSRTSRRGGRVSAPVQFAAVDDDGDERWFEG